MQRAESAGWAHTEQRVLAKQLQATNKAICATAVVTPDGPHSTEAIEQEGPERPYKRPGDRLHSLHRLQLAVYLRLAEMKLPTV